MYYFSSFLGCTVTASKELRPSFLALRCQFLSLPQHHQHGREDIQGNHFSVAPHQYSFSTALLQSSAAGKEAESFETSGPCDSFHHTLHTMTRLQVVYLVVLGLLALTAFAYAQDVEARPYVPDAESKFATEGSKDASDCPLCDMSFEDVDTDRDGVLSREEFSNAKVGLRTLMLLSGGGSS